MIIKPGYKLVNKLFKQGYKRVAGLDEAGRGAWAGPVVAAAVVFSPQIKIKGLMDSKLLTARQRDFLYVKIVKSALAVGVGVVSERVIDQEGIIEATRRAFLKAADKVAEQADYLLVDGVKFFEHDLPAEFLVKGDRKEALIAAASIVAKVTRDRLMLEYHRKYPHYGFDKHKGYGTNFHRRSLDEYGACEIHRQSYQPILDLCKNDNLM